MNQLLNTKKPTTEEQIDFLHQLRTETVRVLKTSEIMDMLKAIQENLVAVKLWNQTHAGTPSELVAGVGKAVDELVGGLIEAKKSIKTWHDMEASPEMNRLNALINKYKSDQSTLPTKSDLFPNGGEINVYTCDKNHATVTIDRSEGVTSFIIGCPQCEAAGITPEYGNHDAEAYSAMYRVPQSLTPTHEFYKPTGEELKDLKADMAHHSFMNLMEHVDQGGLLFRKIQEVSHA